MKTDDNSTEFNLLLQTNDISRTKLKEGNLEVNINDSAYLPDGELKTGWLSNLYATFSGESPIYKNVKSMAIVGIGPGLEALLFIEKMDLTTLYCFDINKEVLSVAKKNIVNNTKDIAISYVFEKSDLVEYLNTNDIKVDLIYENLPNLKSNANLLNGTKTASFYNDQKENKIIVPEKFERYMLGLHYKFLYTAKNALYSSGKVLCCIGGRVPIDVIESMFNDLGYTFKIIRAGVIEQFHADEVLEKYRSHEEHNTDIQFIFLPHGDKRVRQLISDYNNENVVDTNKSLELFNNLRALGLSATKARNKLIMSESVDHLGLIIEGTLI